MEFIVGEQYENRKGVYTVLRIGSDGMLVCYKDGTEQVIKNIETQKRIVKNVKAEYRRVYESCLCSWADEDILPQIMLETLPDYALLNACCWRRICQVRGHNFSDVDEETWVNICTRRGYLFERQNPRGF